MLGAYPQLLEARRSADAAAVAAGAGGLPLTARRLLLREQSSYRAAQPVLLRVRADAPVQSVLEQVGALAPEELRCKVVQCEFVGQPGSDMGGVSRAAFALLGEQLCEEAVVPTAGASSLAGIFMMKCSTTHEDHGGGVGPEYLPPAYAHTKNVKQYKAHVPTAAHCRQ